MSIRPPSKFGPFLIAVANGTICFIAAFAVVSDLSPVSLGNSTGEFIVYAYNFVVIATFPAAIADFIVHGNVHQYFHWTYFAGVFVEGFVLGYAIVGLIRLASRRNAIGSRDAA
jgi:hypothetical protein